MFQKKNNYYFDKIIFNEFNKNISDKFVINIFSLTTMVADIINNNNKTGKTLEFHSYDIMDINQMGKVKGYDFQFNYVSWKGPFSVH